MSSPMAEWNYFTNFTLNCELSVNKKANHYKIKNERNIKTKDT